MKLTKSLIILFFLVGCNQIGQGPIVWDMPTAYADGVFHTINIYKFVEDVQERTHNRLVIRVHSGTALYKLPEIKRAVRSQQVPMGEILLSVLSNENPVYQLDVLPLLATTYQQARNLWQVSRPEVEALLAKEGLKLLYAVPWPPQGLYSKRQINTLADLKGMKVRAYNAMISRLVELMGGIPTTVQTAEIAQAFSTAIIDAMMTSPSTGVSTQAWDYVSHYYDFQAWIPKNIVIVNQEMFDHIPPEIQTALLEASQAAEIRGWEMSERETAEKTNILMEKGIKVMEPTDSLRQELSTIRKAMAEDWQKQSGTVGANILENYQKLNGL